jgi:SAM-dependent methyltransferase
VSGREPVGPDVVEVKVRDAYDAVAEAYHDAVTDELERKPLDRALLDAFATTCRRGAGDETGVEAGAAGPVLDAGCGPGQTMRHLRDRGVPVRGIDLSPAMVAVARRADPCADVRVGSVLDLPYDSGTFRGVLSLYSIIHLPPRRVPEALAEFHRVLTPGGLLLLAFHVGDRPVHVEEFFGCRVDLDGYLFDPATVVSQVGAAGFRIEARLDRRPDVDLELDTDRTYLLARREPTALTPRAAIGEPNGSTVA